MAFTYLFLFFTVCSAIAPEMVAADFRPPAAEQYAIIGKAGSILPGGRIVKPLGTQIETGPGSFGLAISPKGVVATADIGYESLGITIIESRKEGWELRHQWARTPHMQAAEKSEPDWKGIFFGIAFETERSVWISEGNSGRLRLVDTTTGNHLKIVNLNQGEWKNSFTADLAYDAARRLIYVIDQANFRIAAVDARKGQVISSVRVGRMPFAIALSPDGNTAYVTNTGVFRYKPIPGASMNDTKRTGLPFPAFGFPSQESLNGTERQTEAGPVKVPPLGDPNTRESNSVTVIDVHDAANPAVVDWIRTGRPFDSKVFGGSAPSGVLATEDRVYVSNAHDDSITVFEAGTRKIVAEIPLRIQHLEDYRGIMPAGMAYDPVNKWLLVAEAGINAVGIVDTNANALIGHLPVGWMPTKVGIAGDRAYVANSRGAGTGPNLRRPLLEFGEPAFLHRGSVSTFVIPAKSELPRQSGIVYAANGFFPSTTEPPPAPKTIKHVVLIVKENRTYDEVFGDVTAAGEALKGNTKALGFPQIARFGMHGLADGRRTHFSVQDATITPNHHSIAQRWAFSDNFYADSDVSVDGHHWLTGVYPDLLTESGLLAAYSGQRDFVLDADSPGRLLFAGSNSSTHPEEQPEAGTLWHHLERNGITFRNFGEGFELAGNAEEAEEEPTGARFLTNVPMPEPLYRNTSRNYPGFNMNIPDQYRADHFIAEIEERYVKGGEAFPGFIFIHLPNDHMARERPSDGYPYQSSFVEDNDLALGRIVEYLSHSPWWKEMAVFVTEDDAQGGLDHVDSHRTVLLAAGPYVKRNYITHTNSSFPGLLKTIFELLGLPALNLMDASAAGMTDLFTDKPDFAPYEKLIPDLRVFDASKVKLGKAPPVAMDQPQRQ
ncbi:MAG TPA: alkaline phosphatase family protein [Bryobacteraceae bacterium]|nr:alkaline phosphatase family protein [Bryobacteraceae bacterium]